MKKNKKNINITQLEMTFTFNRKLTLTEMDNFITQVNESVKNKTWTNEEESWNLAYNIRGGLIPSIKKK